MKLTAKTLKERTIKILFLSTLIFLITQTYITTAAAKSTQFDYRKTVLDNGLQVITLEDFSCPIVAVQVWYHVGSKNEQPDRQGFAHMFEHMMFRGTDRLGPTDHFSYIRRVGGSSNGYTSFDRTVYLETLPADQLELALWLEAERMTFLKIDQEAFDTERKIVEEECRMRINEPYGTLVENLLDELFTLHSYRWPPIGKIPHLRAAAVQELRDFWQRYYVPSNATLIIVGAVKHEQAQKLAKQYFGWIPKYEPPAAVSIKEPPITASRSVTIKEKNAPTPAAGIAYRTVPLKHPDTVPLDILTKILGEGHSSRLYRQLVAEKQIAVQAQAIHWSLEQDGIFGAGAVMPPIGGDPNAIINAVQIQLQRLANEPVTKKELTKAKNQMLRDLVTSNLKINSKARMLGSAALEYGDVSQVNKHIHDIKKVKARDITRVAKKYLSPDRALKVKIDRNLLGTILPDKKDTTPVTAEPEKIAPKPGRNGLTRPENFATEPPLAPFSARNLTPKYTTKTFKNGLKVIVVPNHEVPFVTIQLGLLPGAWTETKPGTAAMTMKMLTKGTEKYSEGQLAEELETYAISLSAAGQMDTAAVGASCLTEYTDRAMSLIGQVVLHPIFPLDEFEKLRKQVRTSLAISSAEPEYIAEKNFRRALYPNHPYSRTAIGEPEDVDALTVGNLKQWWKKFVRPDMAVLIFAGDIDQTKAFKLAAKTFGKWHSTEPKPDIQLPPIAAPEKTRIYLIDRPGSIQSQIRIGHLGITRREQPGYFVSRLTSSYFGWGFDSRLNKEIRIAKGLTYSVWGSYIANRFEGEFKVGTFTKTESTAQTVQAVLDEIARLRSEPATDTELERSRTYILGSFVRGRETPQQTAADLWMIESQNLGSDYLERLLAAIAVADQNDSQHLIETTLNPDALIIVVVGEAEKIKEDLEKIAPVTLIQTKQPKPEN